jgi:hypothetical protein
MARTNVREDGAIDLNLTQVKQPPSSRRNAMDPIRAGFRAYFGDADLELPDPVPPKGAVTGGGWTVRFVLGADKQGAPVLNFLAEYRMMPPVHGCITADGSAAILDSFQDHFVFDPAVDGDEAAARRRMEAHNRRVARELRRKGLL